MSTNSKRGIQPLAILSLIILVFLISACRQSENRLESQKTKASVAPTSTATSLPTPRSYTSTPSVTKTPTPTQLPVSPLGIDPEDLRGVTVQFWHPWSGDSGEIISQLVETFNEQNEWGIQVQASYQGVLDQIYSNVLSAIDTNQPPDLAVGYLYQALDWDDNWELVDLNEYTNDPLWGFSFEEQDDFYTAFWEHDLSEGRRIGIPAQRSGQLIYYNESWANELGFSNPPAAPEEFRQQACAASNANQTDDNPDNDNTGGWVISTNYSAVLSWMDAYGAVIAPESESNSKASPYSFDTPPVEDSLIFLRELYDDGCAWLSENSYPVDDFAARRGLFATDSVTALPFVRAALLQTGQNDQWTVLPFPSPESEPGFNVYGPSFEILSSTPKEQLASWLFMKWLVSPQNQAQLIETTGAFPLRASILDQIPEDSLLTPQWLTAVEALSIANPEPPLQSWRIVRWTVSDAATQLFRFYFTIKQIPDMIEFLHQTANDLHVDPLKDRSIKSPTPTASPTMDVTPTISTPTTEAQVTPTP